MPDRDNHPAETHKVVLVTGPSGAGRTTAIRALEDLGFEAIDNLPLGMFKRLFNGPPLTKPIALGVDARNRDFSPEALLKAKAKLAQIDGISPELVFVDSAPAVLLRRYSETRRRHPLAPSAGPEEGIRRELAVLELVRPEADLLIDTSDLSPHDLRRTIEKWYGTGGGADLAVEVQSFSYKRGLPPGADMVIDCRFLSNPHWVAELRPLDGRDSAVAAHVAADPRFLQFFDRLSDLLQMLLPSYTAEGRAHFSVAFGCTGGRHRSVFVAQTLARTLADQGWQVSIRHRELDSANAPDNQKRDHHRGTRD
ncbi:RNase adapter RapZ [Shimia biformata]|uniref:RNase adapter RapZ n=1 Tax=Shimia biformata TaxID=1294299 RepID=UPI001950FB5E|nr:RNase adapter RapZ [Shimia biformata]